LLSQGRIREEAPDEVKDQAFILREKLARQAWLEWRRRGPTPPPIPFALPDTRKSEKDKLEFYIKEAKEALEAQSPEYLEKCTAFKLDYLALKEYIEKIVVEEERKVYKGTPDMSLDSIVLTSEFQIVFDATAGTQHLLRILPVLQPPVLGLNPDHTHSLKLTFSGAKTRALASNARSLVQRCLDRLKFVADAANVCQQPQAIYFESVIEAVENSKSN